MFFLQGNVHTAEAKYFSEGLLLGYIFEIYRTI